MCVSPKRLTLAGEAVEVACKHCWQCRAQRKWDYVGRAIAESETCGAENIRAVTLTYGNSDRMSDVPDEFRAVSIVKRDVRLWVKRIRKAGYSVRYMIAAEFGPKKARVHWHALLFFGVPDDPKLNRVPPVALDKRHYGGDEFWDHGMTFWQNFHVNSAAYLLKYMLKSAKLENRLVKSETVKQDEAERTGWMTCSKKPPLGAAYFQQRAERYVDAGLAPQDLIYSFPDVKRGDGTPRKFFLGKQSKTAARFLDHYLQEWSKRYPGRHYPASELVDEHINRTEAQTNLIENHADWVGVRKTPSTLAAEFANVTEHVPGEALRLGKRPARLTKAQQDHNRRTRAYVKTVRW